MLSASNAPRRRCSACASSTWTRCAGRPTARPSDTVAAVDTKQPLVLLHGITMSGSVWAAGRPFVEDRHEVLTPTALGHRGGPEVARRPARVADLVDGAERVLDEHGFERAHLAGNSLGGWM